MQSPIKLTFNTAYQLARPTDLLTIHYPVGQTYQVMYDPGNPHGNLHLPANSCPTITYNGDDFRLAQVHIHDGSEHIVDALKPHTFEVHFVHVPVGGTLNDRKVAIGILYEETSGYSLGGLEAFGKAAPSATKARQLRAQGLSLTIPFTPSAFFPALDDGKPDFINWYHYEGSLTSFPFTENVSWFVLKDPANVKASQAAGVKQYAEQDSRGLQPLDRRIVVRSFSDPASPAAVNKAGGPRKSKRAK